ncbi:MAG: hypothetical protein Q8S18_06415 [Bacteroidales bacterium]|nr:hypothetical protein [Bacteroidales bacterium]
MKRVIIFSILLLAAVSFSCQKEEDSSDLYEGGNLYKSPSGAFYIAQLQGTFKQMGRQYGLMLSDQILAFYQEAVVELAMNEEGMEYDDLVEYGRENYDGFPQIFKDYFDGMAETSGLNMEQTKIMSGIMFLIYTTGCSSLSTWGDYTTDGKTITGRNLDLVAGNLRRFSKYYHIVVWNPIGFPASVANIDFMGGVFYQTAINDKRVFLELQNGQATDTSNADHRENTNNILLESLFRNTTGEEVDRWFNTTLPECGLIMNASYSDYATIYEWATYRLATRQDQGILSASNDFIDPSWSNYPIIFYDSTNEANLGYTCMRRNNLLARGEQYKGQITPQKMMDIFDITLPSGGATFPEEGVIRTIYSVVVKPSELKIWLKVREYSGWEEIDLKPYFTTR